MADKAFDAFSQRRDTGTKDRLTERRRVDTYTDPNRYQMPPRRRLGVYAQNKDMTVTPEKGNFEKLAEGLAKVQPKIMDYLTSKAAEENKQQIQYGIQDAMGEAAMEAGDKEFVDNEWRQFGYEQKKARMQGDAIAEQLMVDVSNLDPMTDFNTWYQDWYAQKLEANPHLSTMNPEHLQAYNTPIQKALDAARNHTLVKRDDAIQKQYIATSTDYMEGTLREAIQYGHEVDNELVERIIADEENMSRYGYEVQNQIVFDAVSRIAIGEPGKRNPEVIKYLDLDRGEGGTLKPISSMRHNDVEQLKQQVAAAMKADEAAEAAKEKAIEDEMTEYTKRAEEHFNLIIGTPATIVQLPGEAADREKVLKLRQFATKTYKTNMELYMTTGLYTREEAHNQVMKDIEADFDAQEYIDPLYKELMAEFKETYANSENYLHKLTKTANYGETALKVFESENPEEVIIYWNDFTPQHQEMVLARGRKEAALAKHKKIETDITRKADLIETHSKSLDQTPQEREETESIKTQKVIENQNERIDTAEKIIEDTNEREQVQEAAEKAFNKQQRDAHDAEIRAKEAAEKARVDAEVTAWHNDVDLAGKLEEEFDTPFAVVPDGEGGYKENPNNARGMVTPSDPSIPKSLLNPGAPLQPPENNILEQVWQGLVDIGDKIYDIYDTDVPDSIEVNPLQEETDYTQRNANNDFETYSPSRPRPQVNTNPNIEAEPKPDIPKPPSHEKETAVATKPNDKFKEKMKKSESSGNYQAVNDLGYMGAYQFGDDRLTDYKKAHKAKFTNEEFLNDPKLQDKVFDWHVKDYTKRIKNSDVYQFVGKTIEGVKVTVEGLIAVAHLGGFGGMRQFVKSGGKDNESDKYGTSMLDYLRKFQ